MLPEAPRGQIAEDHGEPFLVNGGLLLGIGRACSLEANAPSPEHGLPVTLLQEKLMNTGKLGKLWAGLYLDELHLLSGHYT